MKPTLRRSLLVCSSLAFVGTTMIAFMYHAMPWTELVGCFALMGVLMFAASGLLETPRPTMKCLAIWLITVGLCADFQSMWHALAGHPQPTIPVATFALVLVFLGFGLAISTFFPRRVTR